MATTIRPELSKKSPYYIDKQRYYELKHYCRQYRDWLAQVRDIDAKCKKEKVLDGDYDNPTAEQAIRYAYFKTQIEIVERVAVLTDDFLAPYILKGVTEDLTYNDLMMQVDVPCSRVTYYKRYRKFFWILDNEKL